MRLFCSNFMPSHHDLVFNQSEADHAILKRGGDKILAHAEASKELFQGEGQAHDLRPCRENSKTSKS